MYGLTRYIRGIAVDECNKLLLDLIGYIYDCALDPDLWPEALKRVTAMLNASMAAISLQDRSDHSVALKAHWNVSPAFEQSMMDHFAINPLVPAVYFYDVDEPYTGMGFMGQTAYENSKWFQSAVAPHAMGDALIALLAKREGQFGSLSLFREGKSGPFLQEDLDTLKILAPHVRRASVIANILEMRSVERATLMATLDLVNSGVIITDDLARIVHANRAADRMLGGSALTNLNGELSAIDPASAQQLREAMTEAAEGTRANISKAGVCVVAKARDDRDLAVWVMPLDGGRRLQFGEHFNASIAVFVREIGDTSLFPAELFIQHYGITPAEARLLVCLTQGMALAEAAEIQGISLATARTHIARVFDKTGTRSQADLMRLAISALAPASN